MQYAKNCTQETYQEWPRLNETTVQLNSINSVTFSNKKTGSRDK